MISTLRRVAPGLLIFISVGAMSTLAAPPVDEDPVMTRSATRLADPREHLVGRMVPDLEFTDMKGAIGRLSDFADREVLVIAIREEGCPVAKRYGPRLAALESEFAPRGVAFLYVNPAEHENATEVASGIKLHGLTGRYVHDPSGAIAAALRATSSAEVFVLDAARTLRYRGAIDDQYGIGFSRAVASNHFLRDALESVLANEQVNVAATTAPGCVLDLDAEPIASTSAITYHNRISRIVQDNCLDCHRPGSVGPFALDSYTRVKGRKGMIRFALEEQFMPPWHADDTGVAWRNLTALPEVDREAVYAWIDAGCPEGEMADSPLPRRFAAGWRIGEPDAVVRLPEAIDIPAEGVMDYQYAYVQTDFGEDKWISAVEFHATAPQVVHHALIFVEEPRRAGESRDDYRDRWQGGLRSYFGGLIPGQGPTIFPEGTAKLLPAGAWIKFQMHYTPNGEATIDQTEVGFIFADGPPEREMRTNSVATTRFEIPPGASNHEVTAEMTFRRGGTLFSLSPHMHLRGKAFRYDLILPDGRTETLLNIPRYDFNWQTSYKFLEPLVVPDGAKLRATAWYDNSADNPVNPDPTRTVGYGEQTWDEMMIGYFEWWRDE